METASTGTKTNGGYLRAEGSSPPSRFGTITPTTRRSRVSIASGKDVKGRAHWMRVGAWVRRFLERPSTERGRGLDGYRYAEHSHGSGPLIQTDPYQENGSTGRRVAPAEDDRENRQRVLAVQ